MGVPQYVLCFFSSAAFKVLPLSLTFDSLVIMSVGVALLLVQHLGSFQPEASGNPFLVPHLRGFQPLLLQTDFLSLSLSILLLGVPYANGICFYGCPQLPYSLSTLMFFLFLGVKLSNDFSSTLVVLSSAWLTLLFKLSAEFFSGGVAFFSFRISGFFKK